MLTAFALLHPASGAFVTLSQATLMDSDAGRHEQNMARWTFAGSLGVVIGPLALGAAATVGLGWRGLFFVFAGLTLIPLAMAYRFRSAIGQRGAERTDFKAGIVDALRTLRRGEVLRWLTLLEFSDLMLDVLLGFLALYLVDVASATPAQAGMAVAVWTGLGLLGNLLLIPLLERVRGLSYLRLSAVVEVGLGGRLDATNVLSPEVAVITSISRDHTYLLGETLAEIAREKAGIIKPGVQVVSAPQQAEALQVVEEVSRERGSPLVLVGRDWVYEPGPADLDGQAFTVRRIAGGSSALDGEYRLRLLGRHQLENATSAIAALDVLRQQGFQIPAEAVHEGVRSAQWPGRMEVLSRDPLVVADGAHNPYSAQVLRRALEEWFPDRRWVLVFGTFVDKDAAGIMRGLLPISEYVIVTRSEHPRAAAPVQLADVVASLGGGAEVSINVQKAIRRGLAMLGPSSGLLVAGSINLTGAAREEWARHNGAPLPDNDTETEA